MTILKFTSSVNYNERFKRLNTKFNKLTNQNCNCNLILYYLMNIFTADIRDRCIKFQFATLFFLNCLNKWASLFIYVVILVNNNIPSLCLSKTLIFQLLTQSQSVHFLWLLYQNVFIDPFTRHSYNDFNIKVFRCFCLQES